MDDEVNKTYPAARMKYLQKSETLHFRRYISQGESYGMVSPAKKLHSSEVLYEHISFDIQE